MGVVVGVVMGVVMDGCEGGRKAIERGVARDECGTGARESKSKRAVSMSAPQSYARQLDSK